MGGFFNLDGAFYKYGTLIADIMILSILWTITSIPIFTIGASTTAIFYVMTRRISEKERYVVKDYFKSFKENFKQATVLWFAISIVFSVIIFNIVSITNGLILTDNASLARILIIFYFCLLIEIFLVGMYAFPLLSRFELNNREILKTSFFLANKHFPTSLLNIIVFVGIIFAGLQIFIPILFFFVGIYTLITSGLFMRIFKKYKPEIDAD